jgi:hypothetical protein
VIFVGLVEVVFGPESLEPRIRITGGFLQVAGILTVAYGIRETRLLFRKQGLLESATDWLSRFPWKTRAVEGSGLVALAPLRLSAEGYVTKVAGEGASVEKRLSALESNLKDLNERHDQTRRDLNQEVRDRKSALDTERGDRIAGDDVTRRTLEAAETGGLNISVMGAVWLTLGVMLSAASIEIADLLSLSLFSLLVRSA